MLCWSSLFRLCKGKGRRTICDLSYRYTPETIGATPTELATSSTIYVIGGLYGNRYNLEGILNLAEQEQEHPQLIFNGDFNFFNYEEEDFISINNTVRLFTATKGNIEDVISKSRPDLFDCGCDYPSSVSSEYIDRSNEIAGRLHSTAHLNDDSESILQFLRELPMFRRIEMSSGHVVGILHGDAHSLSGWNFSHENLANDSSSSPPSSSSLSAIQWLNEARCDVFACTHTCLPIMVNFGGKKAIVNNGSAGIPNFGGKSSGVITRISINIDTVPLSSLYSTIISDCIRIDAIAIDYNHEEFLFKKFLVDWPEGSPGYINYYDRLRNGTNLRIQDASFLL